MRLHAISIRRPTFNPAGKNFATAIERTRTILPLSSVLRFLQPQIVKGDCGARPLLQIAICFFTSLKPNPTANRDRGLKFHNAQPDTTSTSAWELGSEMGHLQKDFPRAILDFRLKAG